MEKTFCIFLVSELNKINFDEVLETSINTVRKSIDGTKTFVKWFGGTPTCISQLTTIVGYYTYDEILEILATAEWNDLLIT
jgi:sulfatase maturation enzyme AslB (radical SAM superfamily)